MYIHCSKIVGEVIINTPLYLVLDLSGFIFFIMAGYDSCG